ncbi:MAG: SDR family oxidoreductase [Melioribacteraceae bacterium]|nr:SDR family oxidoreductase [Melioribacteraceae bacterium]
MEAEIHPVDISDFDKTKYVIRKVIAENKRIDVLVNNAGIWRDGSVDLPVDEYKNVLDVNVVAPYVILQEVIPQMKKQKSGYIFNVSSRAGHIRFPDFRHIRFLKVCFQRNERIDLPRTCRV